MIEIRRSADRGHAQHGWLDSHHTFSFGSYHDPRAMGFGHLRVINEDRVDPGAGFPPHGHQNMEIISVPLAGALAHRDSTGGGGVIRPGEVQVMSAGRGIRHSEMNGSHDEPVHFMQIWILPAAARTTPRYEDRDFGLHEGWTLLASPDARDGSLQIGQDTDLFRLRLPEGASSTRTLSRRRTWVQVLSGTLDVNGARLYAGDGAAITDDLTLTFDAQQDADALIFDLL